MAIFYPIYVVYFTDAAKIAQLQATYPTGISSLSPSQAAAAFGAPLGGQSPGGAFTPPGIIYTYSYGGGSPPQYPDPTLATGTLSDGTIYQWVGYFLLQGAGGSGVTGNAVVQRRWIHGFELPGGGEGLSPLDSSNLQNGISRDASRLGDGFGLAIRYAQNVSVVRRLDEYGGSLDYKSWERFYLRLRQLSAGDVNIWSTQGGGTGSATDGLYLSITAGGNLRTSNRSIFGGLTTLDTVATALTLNTWYRIDVLVYYAQTPNIAGYYELYLNGVLVSSASVAFLNSGFGGLGRPQNHNSSAIGERFNLANTLEADVDDWSNRVPPVQSGIAAFKLASAIDWNNGTHVRRVRATALDSAGSWTGDYRMTLETPAAGSLGRFTSVTGADQLSIVTDASLLEQEAVLQNGVAAYVVGMYGHAGAGGGNGKLGITTSLTTIAPAQGTVDGFSSQIFGTLGTTTVLGPIKPAHQRGSVGGTATIGLLGIAGEYLGVFRPEDIPLGDTTTRQFPTVLIHNAPYPETAWAKALGPPLSQVSIAFGTYAGNNTGQDITTLDPPHWIWIRPLTGAAGGGRWIATGPTATRASGTGIVADGVVDAFAVVGGAIGFRVSGSDSQVNATGVTYQYMAFCDPGMRYCCAGACRHTSGLASAVNTLPDPSFLPVGVFLHLISLSTSAGRGIWYKGPGHVAEANSSATPLNGTTEQTGVADVNVGTVTTKAAMHDVDGGSSQAYIGFRTVDGLGSGIVAVQIVSYTGDGTGQRTITLTPTSGRGPAFALVAPHAGGQPVVMRDPSHTSTNSSSADTLAIVSNGIVGGSIDQITVHSDYNANGTVYDVFVIPGCIGAGAFVNGVCVIAPPLPGGCPLPFPCTPTPSPGPPPPPPGPPTPPIPPPLPGACTAPILGAGS